MLAGQERLSEAIEIQRQALQMFLRVHGEEDVQTLDTMDNLSTWLRKKGELREAEDLSREGLQTGRRVFGEENPSTFFAMKNLGLALLDSGKLEEAEELCQRAVELSLAAYGEKSRYTLGTMDCVATALHHQGDLPKAEKLFRRILEVRREVQGEAHPLSRASLASLVRVLVKQGKQDEARPHAKELIRAGRRAASLANASARDLNGYASSLLTCELEDLHDPQAALPAAKRAVEMSGGDNAAHVNTLALAHFMTGDVVKAIETQEKAVSLLPPEESPLRTKLEATLAKYRAASPGEDAVDKPRTSESGETP